MTAKIVKMIKDRTKKAHDKQKSYTNNRKRPLEFKVEDRVFLKVPHERLLFVLECKAN